MITTNLGVTATSFAVRKATLQSSGNTRVGAIKDYAKEQLGLEMLSLKDHSTLGGGSIFMEAGGAAHNLLLVEEGLFFV